MKWAKQGRIYCPDGSLAWAKKYAFPPTPLFLPDGTLRMYLASCDENTVGRVGYLDLDPNDPKRILRIAEKPVLDIGLPGAFDENGLLPTVVVPLRDRLYMYYVGYQLGHRPPVRYYQFQGLAESVDGGETFTRVKRTPVLERSDTEMLNRTSAFVRREGGIFQLWYVGGSDWTTVGDKALPVYDLRYLESEDGIRWGDRGEVCLALNAPDEHAFGRPWVVRHGNLWRLFVSVRSRSRGYRLGYAESNDGRNWRRADDKIGIDVSAEGWDSQMIAYSSIVEHAGRVYLFYNGNNCGETGFGYAVLEEW